MFELLVKSHFSAAHFLKDYPGPCANLHGHNYQVEIVVACSKLNQIGIGVDLKILKTILADVLKPLDHACLNEHPVFRGKGPAQNPSSENVAKYIYAETKKRIKKLPVRLDRVVISESEGSAVTYHKRAR